MQNNSECCNNNCNQGRNCPLRAATPAADMGNPISQLNQHVAAPSLQPRKKRRTRKLNNELL